jgi:hypothetical protein
MLCVPIVPLCTHAAVHAPPRLYFLMLYCLPTVPPADSTACCLYRLQHPVASTALGACVPHPARHPHAACHVYCLLTVLHVCMYCLQHLVACTAVGACVPHPARHPHASCHERSGEGQPA